MVANLKTRLPNLTIIKISILCGISLWSVLCCALPEDKLQPYHITSKSIMYDSNTHILTYTQNVNIIQGTTRLSGDKILVYISPKTNELLKLIAYGHPAKYSTDLNTNQSKLAAEANIILYETKKNTVILKKNAKVARDQNIFSGDQIHYDILQGIVRAEALNKQGRTVIQIQGNKEQNGAKLPESKEKKQS